MIKYGLTHNEYTCDICSSKKSLLKGYKDDSRPPKRWSVGHEVKCENCIMNLKGEF